jgi:2-iminobutanoate/2-iminopropanoate deaminase
MSEIKPITTDEAPPAIGPYSQAVARDGVLYCSGQLPIDPADGELRHGSPAEEAARCLANLEAVCQAAGTSMNRALMVTIFTTDIAEFASINEAYEGFFDGPDYPARAAVGIAQLPKGAVVEITAQVAL